MFSAVKEGSGTVVTFSVDHKSVKVLKGFKIMVDFKFGVRSRIELSQQLGLDSRPTRIMTRAKIKL